MSTKLTTIIDNSPNITVTESKFIDEYMSNGNNATKAVIAAGFKTGTPENYGGALLRKEQIRAEIARRLKRDSDARVADATEILRFYTSVMRGEVLDQFGIEASLDTRIKAANELAKHQIELPLKLERLNMTNNIGSITLNFLPRKAEIEEKPEVVYEE